jgi:ankyrin repeat protein
LRVAETLVQYGADIEAKDRSGRSLTSYAASRGRNKHLILLLSSGANVNAVDPNGQSVLHHLAADTREPFKWNDETIITLLGADIDLNLTDKSGRTVLHWAAVTGKLSLARLSLSKSSANVSATTHRRKTALHLAAERGHSDIVCLLLRHGAEKEATSDGNWTPLLNAAKEGHEDVIDVLLSFSANPNVRTSSGRTALHWAADEGHLGVVRRILVEPASSKNTKDNSENTPFSLAAQKDHREIMQILQPYVHGGGLSDHAKHACEKFTAAVIDFYYDGNMHYQNKRSPMVQRRSVYDVLYAPKSKPKLHKGEPIDQSHERIKEGFLYTTNLKTIKGTVPAFRWIHLPANNIAWAEALIMKYFIEHGDLAVYQSLLQSLEDQQHRGTQVHSFYMRPVFEEVWNATVSSSPHNNAKSKDVAKLSAPMSGTMHPATTSLQPNSAPPRSIFTLYVCRDRAFYMCS